MVDFSHISSFNPRAPEGARHVDVDEWPDWLKVSIHAPPKGRDIHVARVFIRQGMFQSTRPRRGATGSIHSRVEIGVVSIHAPPKGRDLTPEDELAYLLKVSIHAPPKGRDLRPGN